MDHHVYLQGSYPNHTNIRGDSDVDVVIETSNVFYHNVPDQLRSQYRLTGPPTYGWHDFRAEVKRALINYYGSAAVADGNKSLKVAAHGSCLAADVVPCNTYRLYDSPWAYGTGITFWTRSGVQIVNFPKTHLNNGARKNRHCDTNYKPNIRMFKNARNQANSDFPSYFLECLTYNVPDNCFSANHEDTFVAAVNYLLSAVNNGSVHSFTSQNEQQLLFGAAPYQIDVSSATRFVNVMVTLWNNWT